MVGGGEGSGNVLRREEGQGETGGEAEKQVSTKRDVLTLENLGAGGNLASLQPREKSQGKLVLSSPP